MTRISTLSQSQARRPKPALGIVTNLTRAADIVDATTANFRMRRIYANVSTVMPATGALRMAGLDHFQLQAGDFGNYRSGRCIKHRLDAGSRGDQHEAQLV